jgi:hypothetical protein
MPFVTTDMCNSPVHCALTTSKNLEDDKRCIAKYCFLDEAVFLLFDMLIYITCQLEEQQFAVSVLALLFRQTDFD